MISTNWILDDIDDNTHPFVNCFRGCKVDHLRVHNPFESIICLHIISPPCKGWSRHQASHTCRSQNHWLARGVPNPGIICWYWIHKCKYKYKYTYKYRYKYKCIIPTFSSNLSYFYNHDDIQADVHKMWKKKYLVVFQEVVQPSRKSNLTFVIIVLQDLMILLEERSGDGDIDMAELIQPSRHSLSSGLIKTWWWWSLIIQLQWGQWTWYW